MSTVCSQSYEEEHGYEKMKGKTGVIYEIFKYSSVLTPKTPIVRYFLANACLSNDEIFCGTFAFFSTTLFQLQENFDAM